MATTTKSNVISFASGEAFTDQIDDASCLVISNTSGAAANISLQEGDLSTQIVLTTVPANTSRVIPFPAGATFPRGIGVSAANTIITVFLMS